MGPGVRDSPEMKGISHSNLAEKSQLLIRYSDGINITLFDLVLERFS
jgi:hypothetical protein